MKRAEAHAVVDAVWAFERPPLHKSGVQRHSEASECPVIAAEGALILVGHQDLAAELDGPTPPFGAGPRCDGLGEFKVEPGQGTDVRMERRLEIRVEEDASELGEKMRVTVQRVEQFRRKATFGTTSAKITDARPRTRTTLRRAHNPQAVIDQVVERIPGTGLAWRSELLEQTIKVLLGLREARRRTAIGLIAAQRMEEQERLVRRPLPIASPPAKLFDSLDPVHPPQRTTSCWTMTLRWWESAVPCSVAVPWEGEKQPLETEGDGDLLSSASSLASSLLEL